jgi:parallel beta-helix repeat protein
MITKIIPLILLFLAGISIVPTQAVTTQDTIRADETWSGAVQITGNLTVIDGILTILPGTQVTFATSTIMFKIKGNGVLRAMGRADAPITFYRGCVTYEGLLRDRLNILHYCNFSAKYHLIEFRNPTGLLECSAPLIDHCTFTQGGYTCIYVTSGGSPTITNCTFSNAACGIFLHGAADVRVAYCTIYNTSYGIINASIDTWFQDLVVDHVTINNIDTSRGYVWSKGLGLTCGNTPGTLNITNSIIANTFKYGINNPTGASSRWAVTEDNNCFFNNLDGPATFTLGTHSQTTDPQFSRPDSGDFSFGPSSPCWLTGNDGAHIGAWQGSAIGIDDPPPAPTLPQLHPGAWTAIYNAGGVLVARLPARDTWNGRSSSGRPAPAGIYVTIVQSIGNSIFT